MKDTRRYTPTSSRLFIWLLVNTYGRIIRRLYRVKASGLDLIAALEPPYVIVANHAMILDPFMIGALIRRPVSWVAADGNMRNPVLRFLLLKLVGTIPKSKAIPDIETIGWIMRIVRERKGIVGIFPEGQATWNGITAPGIAATSKLLRHLKVPVVCASMRGFHIAKPRWAYNIRRVPTEVEFSVALTPEDLRLLDAGEIATRLDAAISHDDWAWARERGIRNTHPKRAERLELALYACPSCGTFASLRSEGATFNCTACGFGVELGEDMRLSPLMPGAAPATILEWDGWQASHLSSRIAEWLEAERVDPFLSDDDVALKRGKRMERMRTLGSGRLELRRSGLVFTPRGSAPLSFDAEAVEGSGVLKWNFFEYHAGKDAYRAVFSGPAVSARIWADAVGALREAIAARRGLNP